jgi:hypothetical protein
MPKAMQSTSARSSWDGRRIPVKQQNFDIPVSTDLVHALRMTACGYFTTVLGPGTDMAREEHLHFDLGMHGTTPNYRICNRRIESSSAA